MRASANDGSSAVTGSQDAGADPTDSAMRTGPEMGGRLLIARYRLDEVLAVSPSGTVHRAFDTTLERDVVIKIISEDLISEWDFMFRERLATEVLAAARLSDPHLATIYDLESSDDTDYVVMEYVGQSLRDEITRSGRLSPARALDTLRGVLMALNAVHGAGLVLGDIKPENVLISESGAVKVTDFGLARAVANGDPLTTVLWESASYWAPEQFTNRKLDPRSDLYATGILLFEMLTGHVPYRVDIPAPDRGQRLPAPSAFVDVEQDVDDLFLRATTVRPSRRFQTAREMLAKVIELQHRAAP